MNINKILGSIMILLLSVSGVMAHVGPDYGKRKQQNTNGDIKLNLREDCQPGTMETDLCINNVRARLSTGGDLWWNRDEGLYIVPKPAEGQDAVSSIFAGGVWVGGRTKAGALKLAGVTYRSLTDNYDWYPGPLDEAGLTDAPICSRWDRFFNVLGSDINAHNDAWEAADESGAEYNCDSIPDGVKYWPGVGNPFWSERFRDFPLPNQSLGAFFDEDGDGLYNPCAGDFPSIEVRGCEFADREKARELVPDEMIYWVYNDNGGPHRLTAGDPIQMEVQVQAFGYATNDEINDMSFYRFKLINRANEDLIDCYFAMWVDPDLGCAFDDYSGVDNGIDVSGKPRSLAYTYNEDAVDGNNGPNCGGGVNTYGFEVPMVGTDYFRGPLGPKVFRRDPDTGLPIMDTLGNKILLDPEPGTGIADTLVELGMTSCIFTFNGGSNPPSPITIDPSGQDEQFYNNMRGLWLDGTPITYGGTGVNTGSTDTVKFMFSDSPNDPTGWSMCNSGLSNVDTRTLQATGPLLLQPGAINELILGVVWVPNVDYPCPTLGKIQAADDLAQALFDNCFDITDGPDAPDLSAVELDQELILALSNNSSSNNFKEKYQEKDLYYTGPIGGDNLYKFEGYKVFQLRDGGVTAQELSDPSKARLIFQTDAKNGVSEIFNWTPINNPLEPDKRLWTFSRQVAGADAGLTRSFSVVEDQFSPSSDRRLINHKPYHFLTVAYGYNNWEPFFFDRDSSYGQRAPYIEGRRNVQVYTFVPRPIVYEQLNSEYGDGVAITRLSGMGNFGNDLELEDGERERMLQDGFDGRITYKPGAGPFDVKIYNPLDVQDGTYRLEVVGEFDSNRRICALKEGATWVLTDVSNGEVIASDYTLEGINEQIISKKGFSISISHADEPGSNIDNNGAIGISFEYENEGVNEWFLPVTPGGAQFVDRIAQSIILDGGPGPIFLQFDQSLLNLVDVNLEQDPDNIYRSLDQAPFFPFYLSRVEQNDAFGEPLLPYLTPGPREGNLLRLARSSKEINLANLNNVDIVFTDNKDLWSRCIVVESASPPHYELGNNTELGTEQMDLIKKPSVGKDGLPDGSGTQGFSWFPGYAVDVETGQRLNIFFGENTIYQGNLANYLTTPGIANDMIFNPSSQIISPEGDPGEFARIVMGGQHYVYVTRTNYDGCEDLAKEFGKANIGFDKMGAITWTAFPMSSASAPLKSIADGLIPNDLTVKLRVNNKFSNATFTTALNKLKSCEFNEDLPAYEFKIEGKASVALEPEEYEGALSNVNVVPNPYYAYSAYENSELVNTIKVTNLPDRAIVTIYSIDGKFIRQYNRAESRRVISDPNFANQISQTNPSLEWDLKNFKGIPISSGVYLIHIAAPDLGEERVIKWFGVNRKFDPTGL